MKNSTQILIMTLIALFISLNTKAQVAGEQVSLTGSQTTTIALVDSNHPTITLSFTNPPTGEAVTDVTNSDLFVRLSLAIWNYGHYHDIGYLSAAITAGAVPPGTELTLVSAPCTTANSGGSLGVPTAPITLSNTAQPIVTSMGDCYTGTGDTDGYQMTFTLKPVAGSFGSIVAGTYYVTVTFTLTVNQ